MGENFLKARPVPLHQVWHIAQTLRFCCWKHPSLSSIPGVGGLLLFLSGLTELSSPLPRATAAHVLPPLLYWQRAIWGESCTGNESVTLPVSPWASLADIVAQGI